MLENERYRYSYGRAFKKELIEKTKIILPSTNDGQSNWKWMEEYIKSMPYSDRV